MNLCLPNVLDAPALRSIRDLLATAEFADGAATAGWHARPLKRNQQASQDEAARRVQQALMQNPLFRAAALPQRLRTPLFSRYRPGMSYGRHVDDALMNGQPTLRTDLALTVFLSEPGDYDGGELVIESSTGEQAWKLPAGQAFLYPATSLHRVAEVTRGERLAAVLWVQSLVRDAARREVLFDLDTVRRSLWEKAGQQHSPEFDLLAKTYSNLLRAWAEN